MVIVKGKNRFILLTVSFILVLLGIFFTQANKYKESSKISLGENNNSASSKSEKLNNNTKNDAERVRVVAEGLDTPWSLAFLPDNGILVTERKGTVRLIKPDGSLAAEPVAKVAGVNEVGEGGLMGLAIDPEFKQNNYIYLYFTYSQSGDDTLNRVVRAVYKDNRLSEMKTIVDAIPGASNHDGGRIKFGPDKYLYITTGDAQEPSLAQDKDSLAGKILKVDRDGNQAAGNPFNNRIYSFGHRNPQGIAWDSDGTLWSSEHGPSGIETGNDEINKIEAGKNYGWPEIRGTQTRDGMVTPVNESGRGNAWAPAGLAYFNGRFYFAGLRGSALYELDASGKNLKTHFKNEYGRLREVVEGPDGMLYVSTSNFDGRGTPRQGDDKILRINPSKL